MSVDRRLGSSTVTSTASIVAAVRRAIRADRLLDGCPCLLLGVSGGADSVAMTHILRGLALRSGPRIVIAHLHHGIRGPAADRDANFVRTLAADLGIDYVEARVDVPAAARAGGLSIEMAARTARHVFFRGAAERCGADRVALAHTADDQAETVVLRLCRGAGSTGLSAMLPDTRIGGLRIVRPLLRSGRDDIEAYLRENGIRWRTDASNRDLRHLRNRVRRCVLPVLERELNPSAREALRTSAEILGAEDEWLGLAAARSLARVRRGSQLDAAGLGRLPTALQRRVVQAWLRGRGAPECAMSFAATERIRAMAAGAPASASATLGSGWRAVKRYGRLQALAPAVAAPAWAARPLRVPGETKIPETGRVFVVRRDRGFRRLVEPGPGAGDTVAWLDAKRVGDAVLSVRSWTAGDRYRPLGAKGTAKIHDILVDAKVDRDLRPGLPVVECGGVIVWFPGHRIADGWEVCGPGAPSLRIEFRGEGSHAR
jgi:tRNA(Ile)-lysidine synthase